MAVKTGSGWRNSLFTNQSFLVDWFDATATEPIPQRYSISLGDEQAVITNGNPEEIEVIEFMFIPTEDEDYRLITA